MGKTSFLLLQQQAQSVTVILLLLAIFLQHGITGAWKDSNEDYFDTDEEASDPELDDDNCDQPCDSEAYETHWGSRRVLPGTTLCCSAQQPDEEPVQPIQLSVEPEDMPTPDVLESYIYLPPSKRVPSKVSSFNFFKKFPEDAGPRNSNPIHHIMLDQNIPFEVGLGLAENGRIVNAIGSKGGDPGLFREVRVPITEADVGYPSVKYLPFKENMIYSTKLPVPPGDDDPRYFFTDLLSGCSIFVDEVEGGESLVVYHANLKNDAAFNPEGDVLEYMKASYEPIMAHVTAEEYVEGMTDLHHMAQVEWGAELDKEVTDGYELNKYEYEDEECKASGTMGTSVMGRWVEVSSRWEFYYQTFAIDGKTRVCKFNMFYPSDSE